MASKVLYPVIAVVGITVASVAGWWYQNRAPEEFKSKFSMNAPAGPASAPQAAASGPRPAGVEVARVERLTLRDDALTVGSLRSRQSVMLRPEVPGRVRELGFVDGARVRKGQVLVQLDDTLQRAEIKQAQAQVSIATANFKRNQELVAQNFVAKRVLEESQAGLQVAEAQLALACARLSRMAILAPFDGTVGMRNVNPGDFVKDGADLINLEDIESMYVDFRLPERFMSKLRQRQSVELQLDSLPGRVFKATVEAIDPLLDINGRSIGVRAILPNTMGEPLQTGARPGPAGAAAPKASAPRAAPNVAGDRRAPPAGAARARPAGSPVGDALSAASSSTTATDDCPAPAQATSAQFPGTGSRDRVAAGPAPLRPGMFARVTTVFAIKESALAVPEEAVVPQGGRQFVIKVVEPSALPVPPAVALPADAKLVSLRQEVKLGVRQSGKVEILDGVAQGDMVVVAGQQRLQRDGTLVRVVEAPRSGPSAAPTPAASAAAAAASAPQAKLSP